MREHLCIMRAMVWFRGEDVRVGDHAALHEARGARELLCVFVLEPFHFSARGVRSAPHRIQFLLESLQSLHDNLEHRGNRLLCVHGPAEEAIAHCAERWKPDGVYAQRSVLPASRARDVKVESRLSVPLHWQGGQTLSPAGAVRSGSDAPYAVYSAFARAFRRDVVPDRPLQAPAQLPPVPSDLDLRHVVDIPSPSQLGLEPNSRLQSGGERAARRRLADFLKGPAAGYDVGRDRMDQAGTSRLSADLKFGTLSVRTAYTQADQLLAPGDAKHRYLNELLWREFSHHTLHDRPHLLREPFRADFCGFPWRDAPTDLQAWKQGQTGYPIVDAAMRQLLAEGFVHNRARMIAASFLCKHLMVHYREGERHYLRWLVDGCPAQNNMGWQWSSGSGCDAQPYFRVFNPMTQGQKFDPDGEYVHRWVPELAQVPSRHVHAPWKAPAAVLKAAGVRLGREYPEPMVDHAAARERFLDTAKQHIASART